MKLLEDKILTEGRVVPGGVLKVDSFLNHRIDIALIDKLAEEWAELFKNEKITKIVTIEASGIALASILALRLNVPIVFAKKIGYRPGDDLYAQKVVSLTHGNTYNVVIAKKYISADDKILLIDDFLANGSALRALIKICEAGGATIVGAGIAVEKAYQKAGDEIRSHGYRIESLAKIESIDPEGGIQFC